MIAVMVMLVKLGVVVLLVFMVAVVILVYPSNQVSQSQAERMGHVVV